MYIPNSFTPNGDGLNEQFMAYGLGIRTFEASIFNRWGQEIYKFTDILKGWGGQTVSGGICEMATYVYKIKVVDVENKEHEFIGKVNLIR